jgi:ferredoxin-NADP reductase
VRQETPFARTFRLVPAGGDGEEAQQHRKLRRLPPFRAGQYLSLEFVIRGVRVSRPYSICCSPAESRRDNFYELTIRRRASGFVAPYIWEQWRPGTLVSGSGPLGTFGYEPLRDRRNLVFLAGGCGITPFRSLWRELRAAHPEVSCSILYGAATAEQFIFRRELEGLAVEQPDRFRVHLVAEKPAGRWDGPTGLIDGQRIRELTGDPSEKTFYLCGPPGMHRFLEEELAPFGVPAGSLRKEPCGETEDVTRRPDYPGRSAAGRFTVTVHRGAGSCTVSARAEESVLVALERAGLAPPAQCRSGFCGYCRSLLIKGRVYVLPESDGRREADRRFGHFHPCSSYPLTDLEIRVPVHPLESGIDQSDRNRRPTW